jgi:hypothetical protein
VIDEGNDGSLGGQAKGDELREGGKGSIGEGLLGGKVVCVWEDMVREVSLKTERGFGDIC